MKQLKTPILTAWDNPLTHAIGSNQSSAFVTPEVMNVPSATAFSGEPPLEKIASLAPINPDDKRIVNASTDINQLAPFKYPWAWEFFSMPIRTIGLRWISTWPRMCMTTTTN